MSNDVPVKGWEISIINRQSDFTGVEVAQVTVELSSAFYDPGRILSLEQRVEELLNVIRKQILGDFR